MWCSYERPNHEDFELFDERTLGHLARKGLWVLSASWAVLWQTWKTATLKKKMMETQLVKFQRKAKTLLGSPVWYFGLRIWSETFALLWQSVLISWGRRISCDYSKSRETLWNALESVSSWSVQISCGSEGAKGASPSGSWTWHCVRVYHTLLALVASGMQGWPGHGEKLKLVRVLVTVQPWLQRRPQHTNHARTLEGPQRKAASEERSQP